MGIKDLSRLIADNAPGAIRSEKFENYFGRKIAVDASMHIYQFMIAVGRSGDNLLTNEAGDVTSHLQARRGALAPRGHGPLPAAVRPAGRCGRRAAAPR